MSTKRQRKHETTREEVLQQWYSHVKQTPSGHVPVLFGGVPAWRIVGTRQEIERNFSCWPREYWPEWVAEVLAAFQRERDAQIADGMIGATRHEIAAAIRKGE